MLDVAEQAVLQAARYYRDERRAIRVCGYTPLVGGGDMFDWPVTPLFLAGLIAALVAFGATPDMARKVVKTGLRVIRRGYNITEEDSWLLRHYRNRAGTGVSWFYLPQKGCVELRKDDLTISIGVG